MFHFFQIQCLTKPLPGGDSTDCYTRSTELGNQEISVKNYYLLSYIMSYIKKQIDPGASLVAEW